MALTGSNNEQKIWNYLYKQIKNAYGVAGLMGNLYAESALKPTNLQNSYEKSLGMTDDSYTKAVDNGTYNNFVKDKAGYGLAQWTYWSRKQNLLSYAKAKKKSIGDLETQLGFLWKELSESYTAVLKVLKNATSVMQASNSVLLDFERPANQSSSVQIKRASYGMEYYDKYAGSSGDTDKGGTSMSNSPLVTYKKITNNRTSPRNHKIDTITIHCIVGQWTAKQGCDYFASTTRQCSANYVVGKDGSIGLSVEEKDRSWCSSSASNDNRAITIEVASDTKEPYAVTDKAMSALIELLVDICKRNDIKKLLWKGDKKLIGQVDKQNMTVHRWFANKSCPGTYLYERHGWIADQVNAKLGSGSVPADKPNTPAEKNDIPKTTPFTVRVLVSDLRIRSTGSMSGDTVGYTGKGVFTIVETNGAGFGLLKSYQKNRNGWIYLENPDYVKINQPSNPKPEPEATKMPYRVQITIPDLNIRKTPDASISTNKVGKFTGKGVFTIVDEAIGPINTKGTKGKWGLLKSYQKNRNGWICLEVDGVKKL